MVSESEGESVTRGTNSVDFMLSLAREKGCQTQVISFT